MAADRDCVLFSLKLKKMIFVVSPASCTCTLQKSCVPCVKIIFKMPCVGLYRIEDDCVLPTVVREVRARSSNHGTTQRVLHHHRLQVSLAIRYRNEANNNPVPTLRSELQDTTKVSYRPRGFAKRHLAVQGHFHHKRHPFQLLRNDA
jgi:hypothetical protein